MAALFVVVCMMAFARFIPLPTELMATTAPAPLAPRVELLPESAVTAAVIATRPNIRVAHLPARPIAPPPAAKASVVVPACMPADRAYANGQELTPLPPAIGHGQVTIVNDTDSDAVVKLSPRSPNEFGRHVYVAAGQEVRLDQIDAGDYRLMFTLGTGWSADQRKFCTSPEYSEFGKDLHFQEKRTYEQIEYDHAQVTLHGVAGGNIPVRKLTEQEFLAN